MRYVFRTEDCPREEVADSGNVGYLLLFHTDDEGTVEVRFGPGTAIRLCAGIFAMLNDEPELLEKVKDFCEEEGVERGEEPDGPDGR